MYSIKMCFLQNGMEIFLLSIHEEMLSLFKINQFNVFTQNYQFDVTFS